MWDAINLHQILYYYDMVFMSQYPLDSKNIEHEIWAFFFLFFYSPQKKLNLFIFIIIIYLLEKQNTKFELDTIECLSLS